MKLVNKLMVAVYAAIAVVGVSTTASAHFHHHFHNQPLWYVANGVTYPAYYTDPGIAYPADGVYYNETGMYWVSNGVATPYVGYFYSNPAQVYFADYSTYTTVYSVPEYYYSYPVSWEYPRYHHGFQRVGAWVDDFFNSLLVR